MLIMLHLAGFFHLRTLYLLAVILTTCSSCRLVPFIEVHERRTSIEECRDTPDLETPLILEGKEIDISGFVVGHKKERYRPTILVFTLHDLTSPDKLSYSLDVLASDHSSSLLKNEPLKVTTNGKHVNIFFSITEVSEYFQNENATKVVLGITSAVNDREYKFSFCS